MPAVEALDPGVLPRDAGVDEDRVGAVEPAPVGDGVGDELGPVVEADVGRGAPLGRQALEAGDDPVGVDGALDVDGQALAGELVDDVQQLEHPPVGGLVELEVERPDDVRPDRAHRPDRPRRCPAGASCASCRAHAGLLPPEAVDPLVVDPPAGLLGRDGGPPPAPAGTTTREVPQQGPQGQLVVGRNRAAEALGGAGLADHPAGPSFGHPEPLPEDHHGPPAAVRGQKFPRFSSFSMSMSSAWSATIFFRRWFSLLELLQLLGVVGLHAAVLVPPTVPGRLGDLEVTAHLVDGLALAEELVALGQLADDLLGRVPASLHGRAVLLPHIVGLGLAQRVDQLPSLSTMGERPKASCNTTNPSYEWTMQGHSVLVRVMGPPELLGTIEVPERDKAVELACILALRRHRSMTSEELRAAL